MYKIRPPPTLYSRITTNLRLSPYRSLLWSPNRRSVPHNLNYGMANRSLLCNGRYVPLLGT